MFLSNYIELAATSRKSLHDFANDVELCEFQYYCDITSPRTNIAHATITTFQYVFVIKITFCNYNLNTRYDKTTCSCIHFVPLDGVC